MTKKFMLQSLAVLLSFIVALLLEVSPVPKGFEYFRPAWILLVLFYWNLAIASKINIGAAFVCGITLDLLSGQSLGMHSIVLCIFSYIMVINHLLIRNLSIWIQAILITGIVFLAKIGFFLVGLFLHGASFNLQEILGAILSGLLWPWVFLLLRLIRRKVNLR